MFKKIIPIFTLLLTCNTLVFSQDASNAALNTLALSIVLPDNTDTINFAELSKIESKLQQIVSKQGISGVGYESDFVLYPKFEVYDEQTLDGGMVPMKLLKGNLSLFIKQVSTNKVFASTSIAVNGAGSNRNQAVREAIRNINVNDAQLANFVVDGKKKILEFYNKKCDLMVAESEKFYKANKFDNAIALLSQIPAEASCYTQVQDLQVKYYLAYQDKNCNQLLLLAKSKFANQDYDQALEAIADIDPTSKCKSDAKALIDQIGTKLNKLESRNFDATMKLYEDQKEIEKQRLVNIKEITTTIYKNLPHHQYNYNTIIK